MFDFITRRRLIFGLLACFFVTISILFIARLNSISIHHVVPSYNALSSSNISTNDNENTCYLTEQIQVLSACDKCTAYERRSKAAGCNPTGYRESLQCLKSKIKTFRSCPIPESIKQRHFWIFQTFIFFLSLISIIFVHTRQRLLDKQMVEKIKRQIGESEQ